MAASRLSDSQKQELVQRYQQGESSAELAAAFGCSANTVSRTVKAALDPAEYERLKQRGRTSAAPATEDLTPVMVDQADVVQAADQDVAASENTAIGDGALADDTSADDSLDDADEAVLAIDDADDFDADDDDLSADDLGDDDPFTPIAVLPLVLNQEPVQIQPLVLGVLPESLYMLVDKTVELQPKPLREFTELGTIPSEQEERQALQLFANPRQAKRQCGRTQRVIKMPDPGVFVRQASYLHVKGISHLVVEGSLYALPGGH